MYEELRRDHRSGDRVSWSTLGGKTYRGVLKEWDNYTAIVVCDDGRERSVSC